MKSLFTIIVFLALIETSTAQWLFTSKVNTSSIGSINPRSVALQGSNNIYVAFRRGNGTAVSDREIKVAVSNDSGRTFKEVDITRPNSSTFNPKIAASGSAIVIIYAFDDPSNIRKVCIARSINSGQTFSTQEIISKDLERAFYGFSRMSTSFISDGVGKFFLIGGGYYDAIDQFYLCVSTDNGSTFNRVQMPIPFSNILGFRMSCSSTQLWFSFASTQYGGDTIKIYRSSNAGQSWNYSGGITAPGITFVTGYNPVDDRTYDINAKIDQLYLYYLKTVLSAVTTYKRIVTTSLIGSETAIGNFNIDRIAHGTNSAWLITGLSSIRRNADITLNNWGAEYKCDYFFNTKYSPYIIPASDDIYYVLDGENNGNLYLATFKYLNKPMSWTAADTTLPNGWFKLSWRSFFTSGSFRLQFSKTINFTSTIWDTLISNQKYINNEVAVYNIKTKYGADSGRVYFRLRSEEGTFVSDWSDIKTFKFGTSSQAFLLQPSYGAAIPNAPNVSPYTATIVFQWSGVTSASYYLMHLAEKDDFVKLLTYYENGISSVQTQYSFTFNSLILNNQKIFWRVKPIFADASSGPWSATSYFTVGTVTDVQGELGKGEMHYSIGQNYPNPFNPATTIQYSLPARSMVTLKVINILGQEVVTLVNGIMDVGTHNISWNAVGTSGLYFYKMEAVSVVDPSKHFTETKKMLFLR